MALSVANAETQLKNALTPVASVIAETKDRWQTAENTLVTGALGERYPSTAQAIASARAALSSIMSPGTVAGVLRPALLELGEAIGAPSGLSDDQLFDYLEDYYDANSRTIQSRDITYGSISAGGGNTGNGNLYRVTVDRFGNDIESTHVEAKSAECVRDQSSLGSSGRFKEVFRFEGQPAPIDSLDDVDLTKSGNSGIREFPATTPESQTLTNGNLISNNSSGGVTTMFSGWTLSATTGISVDTSTTYIASSGQTAASIKIESTGSGTTMTQTLKALDRSRPYLPLIAWNREDGSGSGVQIRVDWGSKNQTVTAGGAETGWQIFAIDRDVDLWPDNFYEDQQDFKLTFTVSSGYFNVAFIHFIPGVFVDNIPYFLVPGSTPFQKGDTFTWTDSFTSSDSILQKYLVYGFGRHLPHSGTPTVSDPSLPA